MTPNRPRPIDGLRAGALVVAAAVLVATIAVLAFASPGAGVAPAAAIGPSSCQVPTVNHLPSARVTEVPPRTWPLQLLQRGVLQGAFDPATETAYEMEANMQSGKGYGRLVRIDARTHVITKGASFRVTDLALASGSLWVFGGATLMGVATGPVLCQLNPRTLAMTRQIALPPTPPSAFEGFALAVTAGPGRSIWVGYDRTVVEVSTTTGAVLRLLTMPSGDVSTLTTSLDHRLLYVSLSYPTVDGTIVDAQVIEFNQSGTQLVATGASPSSSPVYDSVNGGQVLGVPGGVVFSARSGMHGGTEILTASTLTAVPPPGLSNKTPLLKSPADVFGWPMDASILYGGGSLWISNGWGVLACIDPVTSAVRAFEGQPTTPGNVFHMSGAQLQLLGTDAAHRALFALAGNDLYAITAPAACWT
jgi:hypothetical protein